MLNNFHCENHIFKLFFRRMFFRNVFYLTVIYDHIVVFLNKQSSEHFFHVVDDVVYRRIESVHC